MRWACEVCEVKLAGHARRTLQLVLAGLDLVLQLRHQLLHALQLEQCRGGKRGAEGQLMRNGAP